MRGSRLLPFAAAGIEHRESLLLTLIGYGLSQVPFAWPVAYRLNLIAPLIGTSVDGRSDSVL